VSVRWLVSVNSTTDRPLSEFTRRDVERAPLFLDCEAVTEKQEVEVALTARWDRASRPRRSDIRIMRTGKRT